MDPFKGGGRAEQCSTVHTTQLLQGGGRAEQCSTVRTTQLLQGGGRAEQCSTVRTTQLLKRFSMILTTWVGGEGANRSTMAVIEQFEWSE